MLHCEITSNGKTDIIYEVLCAKCGMTSWITLNTFTHAMYF